jgi:hypothetical protein
LPVLTTGAALALAVVVWSAFTLTVLAIVRLRRREAKQVHL